MSPNARKIAFRYYLKDKIAKTFKVEVGAMILYGKYKNKKGKIVGFKKGPKGDQIIVVEPVPKGRKQEKDLKLFTIRQAPQK